MPSNNITTTAAQVVAAAPRALLIFQNRSDEEIFVGFSAAVSAAPGPHAGIGIPPGGTWTLVDLPGDSTRAVHTPIYAVHAGAGDKELRYITI